MEQMKKSLWWYAIGVLLFATCLIFDKQLAYAAAGIRTPALTLLFQWISYAATVWALVFIAVLVAVKSYKKAGLLIADLAVVSAAVFLLKFAWFRQRPFEALGIANLNEKSGVETQVFEPDSSFPSGHTARIFATVPAARQAMPMLGYIWGGFAVLVGLSRVYLGMHYLSDVIAGALISLAITQVLNHYIRIRIARRKEKEAKNK